MNACGHIFHLFECKLKLSCVQEELEKNPGVVLGVIEHLVFDLTQAFVVGIVGCGKITNWGLAWAEIDSVGFFLAAWQIILWGLIKTCCSNPSLQSHLSPQCAASASEWQHYNPSDSWAVWECCPKWSPLSGNLPSAVAAPEASDSPSYLHIDWTRHAPKSGL